MRKAMTINTRQAYRKATSQIPQESNTQKQVGEVGEPYATPVMRCEQLESMNHMFSKSQSITYIGREGVDGSMLGLVR
jgi:hypothetical protein